MQNPGAPCTNCGCKPDDRATCPLLQLPLRLLPSGCNIPSEYFAGKRVLVTGATSGIGLQTAKLFQLYGAKVTGTSRNPKKAPCVPYPLMKLNMADDEEIDKLIKDYIKENGCPPDILIDNGAQALFGTTMDSPDDLIEYELRAVGSGHVRLIQGFIRKLPSKNSRFISLSTDSVSAYLGAPILTTYGNAKGVLRQFIQNWGLENSQVYPNVFLGSVNPMVVNTNFVKNAIKVGVETNPLTAQFMNWVNSIIDVGMDPIIVGKAFIEFAYTQSQGQTCDIGYLIVNNATPETIAADFATANFLNNPYNNQYPIDFVASTSQIFQSFGVNMAYNPTYTQCP